VLDPSNPSTFAPAGTRWLNEANYTELDFYLEDNRRLLDLNGFTFLLQPYPQFTGGLNVFDSNDYSNYGGLQFIFKRRINTGLGFQFGYTLSKSKDNRSRNSGSLVLESGKNFWFDTTTRSQFSAPAPGSIGNTGRNFFLAPNYFQWDASLQKRFRITEKVSFYFRLDARNVLNKPSFDNPTAVITSSIFGRINDSVTNNARRIQLSGKLSF